ncbi:MAG: pilus assembly protein PilP [Burkholderiaceae bacterium]|jgi:type IV pilus assembly protein PilP
MKRLPFYAVCLLLASCGSSTDEVRDWMAQVKKEIHPIATKLPEPKTYEAFVYADKNDVDPFDPAKITNVLRKLAAKSTNGLAPDVNRRKEPLEAFPLDNIAMVGTLERPGLHYALLRAEGIVYQIKVGNYVGQNFGVVTKISDSQVTLKEVVQDASGEWVERISTLQLQESTK